ncbi:MAG: type IV pilus modification protein PilV [Gammaproteobacteria bacterium]|nr:type IV pilus modification protein PilV [Gammaproteobacteria bacterium]
MYLNNRQRGVGLVEVLAALFVLSVGLLGIAGLQAQGLIAGFNASQRSVAVVKAYEIIERMRGNPEGVNDGLGVTAYATAMGGPGAAPGVYCADLDGNPGADCNIVQLANFDIFSWKESIDDAFPNMAGMGAVQVNLGPTPTAPTNVVVTVQWTERGVVQNYSTNTQFVRVTP